MGYCMLFFIILFSIRISLVYVKYCYVISTDQLNRLTENPPTPCTHAHARKARVSARKGYDQLDIFATSQLLSQPPLILLVVVDLQV